MILLTDVAAKLEELLNSFDSSDLLFVVKSQGYHLDTIASRKKARNAIPVFLSIVGGEYNPVPNLHQIDFIYEASIYFPVRFKEFFYNLNINLDQWFVGKKVQFGNELALCNIAVAEYGEIIGLQADQFENWVDENYGDSVHVFKNEEEINEPYMSMVFKLYLTTLGSGFMFGNDVNYKLTMSCLMKQANALRIYNVFNHTWKDFTYDNSANEFVSADSYYAFKNNISYYYVKNLEPSIANFLQYYQKDFDLYQKINGQFYKVEKTTAYVMSVNLISTNVPYEFTTDLIWDNSGTGMSVSPVAQQLIKTDKYAKNIVNIVNYNKSIMVYPNNDDFWKYFLFYYNTQDIQSISNIKLTKQYSNGLEFDFNQLTLAINENVELGSPLSFTITVGDKK